MDKFHWLITKQICYQLSNFDLHKNHYLMINKTMFFLVFLLNSLMDNDFVFKIVGFNNNPLINLLLSVSFPLQL